MAAGSVFAASSGEASLGFGGNFDNGNYGFIDSGAKVKIDADLATATAEQIAEGDVYASIKATFGLKLTTGEKTRGEVEDPTDVSFDGSSDYKVGIIADLTAPTGEPVGFWWIGLHHVRTPFSGFGTRAAAQSLLKSLSRC